MAANLTQSQNEKYDNERATLLAIAEREVKMTQINCLSKISDQTAQSKLYLDSLLSSHTLLKSASDKPTTLNYEEISKKQVTYC